MGEVASGIAHEINQPLTSIKALTGVLGKELASSASKRTQETIDKIRRECDRASQIIRATRDALRQQVLRPEPIVVSQLLTEMEEMISDRLSTLNVEFVKNVAPKAARIVGDRVQIGQAIYNLIDNSLLAIEESGKPGEITVTVRVVNDSEVEFEVRDTGPGFLPDVFQLDAPPYVSTRNEGTGIGISIARSVAEAHGGRLTIGRQDSATCVRFAIAAIEQK
jgi:two-component system sensor kinase FixL